MSNLVVSFKDISIKDVSLVGGKTASLGEMLKINLPVPKGFAITSKAYDLFINDTGLKEKIKNILSDLNTHDIKSLKKKGKKIRNLIKKAKLPSILREEIKKEYNKLNCPVAVRSSATAEDLPSASFAGQQESFLNVVGYKELIKKVKECFASLFTDRAISYREDKGFDHFKVKLSVAVQKMVKSKVSGVMFTLDPNTGFRNVITINASYGLGDYIVQGVVTPDEFTVFKPFNLIIEKKLGSKKVMEVYSKRNRVKSKKVPKTLQNKFSLSDKQIIKLSEYGMIIEKHYKRPMDIEWALGEDDKIYILQARPETVYSNIKYKIKNYSLKEKSKIILKGIAIGKKISTGKVNKIKSPKEISKFKKGDILVTKLTDPDWEPIMKIASGIITDYGGKTSHAAIVSRELGIPCIVGTENGTRVLKNNTNVTIDCSDGFVGKVWKGKLKYEVKEINLSNIPKTKTKIMLNISNPDEAFELASLPVDGVGLAREEFIIQSYIGIHPLYMIYLHKEKEFIKKLSEGLMKIAAAFYPKEVIVRFSDFKSNEYKALVGGDRFEPLEQNPMIGWRGASRYTNKEFEPAFRLECKAIKEVRKKGFTNLNVMIPFCRTINEAKKVLKIMKDEGLVRGKNNLKVYVMAEIPSNIILADKFSKYFDGFSIGSNDLTQLTLGIDRDSEKLSYEFDERNEAVLRSIKSLINTAHKYKKKVSICGQAPSTYKEYLKFLVKNKIDAISFNPDVVIQSKLNISKLEKLR